MPLDRSTALRALARRKLAQQQLASALDEALSHLDSLHHDSLTILESLPDLAPPHDPAQHPYTILPTSLHRPYAILAHHDPQLATSSLAPLLYLSSLLQQEE